MPILLIARSGNNLDDALCKQKNYIKSLQNYIIRFKWESNTTAKTDHNKLTTTWNTIIIKVVVSVPKYFLVCLHN